MHEFEPAPVASTSSLEFRLPPTALRSARPRPTTRPGSEAFFRNAKLCPDGSCVLVAAEDRSLSLFALDSESERDELDEWLPVWTYDSPDALLAFEWFPGASSTIPVMFALAVAVKDHPVMLLDGSDCRIRASYPIIDHQEKFVAPYSLAFSQNGASLYCGFENAIEILDISSPGSTGLRLHTSPTRNSRIGQKGIISSLAFSPDHSGLLAAGSFSGSIGIYDTSTPEHLLLHLLKSTYTGGITQVLFHPASHLLYSASRLSDSLEIWDMRNLSKIKGTLKRDAKTNQRLGFDVDASGTWLACGDQHGMVHVYGAEYDSENLGAVVSFTVSPDAVGSVLFNSSRQELIAVSGMRHYTLPTDSESDASDESDGNEASQEVGRGTTPPPSLKLWKLS